MWDQLAALDAPSLLDLYKGQEPPRELAARRQNVIQALREKAGRWILLLDAADSEEARDAVNGLLKELAGGRFVITSRRDDWSKATVRKLSLELFTIEEARACLLSRYWKPEPSADELAGFENVAQRAWVPAPRARAGRQLHGITQNHTLTLLERLSRKARHSFSISPPKMWITTVRCSPLSD